jgi:DNA polymerase elongation subunit (family B)
MSEPRVLLFDIETAPMQASVWGLWDQNIGINQIEKDWHVLSWAAKWLGEGKIHFQSQRKARNVADDRKILKGIWDLLNEADIVVTQNGKAFDSRKLNARFVILGMDPPSPYKHKDTKELAKRHFAFPSYSLEYMAQALQLKNQKLKSTKFIGFDLWKECLKGNPEAWKEMERYNCSDVLALEELYLKIRGWDDQPVNRNLYAPDGTEIKCPNCGSHELHARGYNYSATGKFQRYQCYGCGAWTSAKGEANNLISRERRAALRARKGVA